jgi:hypothetical protein
MCRRGTRVLHFEFTEIHASGEINTCVLIGVNATPLKAKILHEGGHSREALLLLNSIQSVDEIHRPQIALMKSSLYGSLSLHSQVILAILPLD